MPVRVEALDQPAARPGMCGPPRGLDSKSLRVLVIRSVETAWMAGGRRNGLSIKTYYGRLMGNAELYYNRGRQVHSDP